MSREKKQSFMGGVTVMAISTVFVKICGALYKIPLNNILGDEGLTHFNSAYNIYALLLSLSTAGLPLALSKLVSEANGGPRCAGVSTPPEVFSLLWVLWAPPLCCFLPGSWLRP